MRSYDLICYTYTFCTVSTCTYIYYLYTVCTQYVHSIYMYILITYIQYVHSIYMYLHILLIYSMYTVSTCTYIYYLYTVCTQYLHVLTYITYIQYVHSIYMYLRILLIYNMYTESTCTYVCMCVFDMLIEANLKEYIPTMTERRKTHKTPSMRGLKRKRKKGSLGSRKEAESAMGNFHRPGHSRNTSDVSGNLSFNSMLTSFSGDPCTYV